MAATSQNPQKYSDYVDLIPDDQKEDVLKLAAVGLTPVQIAAAIELSPEATAAFVALADIPGSPVCRLIEEGRAAGISVPQIKLQEAAVAGNIDAIKMLQQLQHANRFNELIYYMDDDEFTG